ncbi:MAG: GDP-mannose 4,6-dehydratase [Gemmatimonadaceae bacterium]
MTRALIIGSEGQDGSILFDRITADGGAVLGLGRDSLRGTATDGLAPINISSREQMATLLGRWRPDEIYYLPAVHQASEEPVGADDAALFNSSLEVHVTGLVHVLEEIRKQDLDARVFYAASSLVFGDVTMDTQDERTPMRPRCIYGITKATGVNACRFYREMHGLHASAGILYNHESPLRRRSFVSQKIIRSAVAISRGSDEKLVLGDLSARIDWGYAPDYVDAMIRVVRQPSPDDYVIASGEPRSVQEFAEVAFGLLGLDWRSHVVEDSNVLTRRSGTRVGNSAKLRERTGWSPRVTFAPMIAILLEAAQHNAG